MRLRSVPELARFAFGLPVSWFLTQKFLVKTQGRVREIVYA